MAKSPVVSLALRLGVSRGFCMLCSAERYPVEFTLHYIQAEGMTYEDGISICPACVAAQGYQQALINAISVEEAELVQADRQEAGSNRDAERREAKTRAHCSHLRSLVTGGLLVTPPPIPPEHIESSRINTGTAVTLIVNHSVALLDNFNKRIDGMEMRLAQLTSHAG